MKVAGEHEVPAGRERAWEILRDPAVLARCMPGCERLDLIAEKEYAMRMKVALASVSGLFDGKIRIADETAPQSFRLIVEGTGRIGFLKGDGLLQLSENGAGTSVRYEGDVQVGGTIASVGQRLLDTTARMLIKRFFTKLNSEAGRTAGGATG